MLIQPLLDAAPSRLTPVPRQTRQFIVTLQGGQQWLVCTVARVALPTVTCPIPRQAAQRPLEREANPYPILASSLNRVMISTLYSDNWR